MTRKVTAKKTSTTKTTSRRGAVRSKVSKTATTTASTPRKSKKSILTDLLKRAHGASIDEMVSATGWQAHSIRAAITGLRKDGLTIPRSKESGGGSVYRVVKGNAGV